MYRVVGSIGRVLCKRLFPYQIVEKEISLKVSEIKSVLSWVKCMAYSNSHDVVSTLKRRRVSNHSSSAESSHHRIYEIF